MIIKSFINKWVVLTGEKNIEDPIKDGLIITATTIEYFFAIMTAKVKPPKVSLDVVDIIKLIGEISGGVLIKDYVAYEKWINE